MKPELRTELIPVEQLLPDPGNPRTFTDEDLDARLVESISRYDVQVPLICFQALEGIMIADGHRRWLAAKKAGKKVVPAYILPKRPDEAELLTLQLTIDAHRSNLNAVDECEAFQRLLKVRGWSQAQLAAGLAVSATAVTATLSISKLTTEERQLVREGKISKSAAYALARMPADKRAPLAEQAAAGELTRDQLNAKARRKTEPTKGSAQRISCVLPSGNITVKAAQALNLSGLITLLEELLRNCRKARSDGLDVSTAVRVWRDRSRAAAS